MLANNTGKIDFVYIANPLTPAESRLVVPKNFEPSKSLADYLGPLEGEWVVSVSGKIVSAEELALTFPSANDVVVLAPVLMGGGGENSGKTILRLVLIVVITYFTMGAGGMGAGSFMGLTGGTGWLAAGAVMIGGTMLVNAALPPPKPDLAGAGGFNSSPTYGVDGPKNLSTKNVPVPVIYGETWFAGNFIQTYTENDGDTQYLHMLLNVGEGPIEAIEDIHINDQPITSYTGVEVFKRYGTADQEPIPYFADIIRPVSRGITLKAGIWSSHTTTEPVDRLRFDIVMPKGINRLDDEDGMVGTSTSFKAEIREIGGTWEPFTGAKDKLGNPTSNITISGRSMSPLRRSYYSKNLDKTKRYELRFIHNEDDTSDSKSNSISITDINEILFDDIAYKHTALLGLRIKLSDQLNGIPKVIYRVKGRKVNVWDASTGTFVEQWTDNPAWIVIDAMTNKRFGGGLRIDRFKLDYFRQWAAHCETNGLKFNGAIDQKTNLWDALAPVFKVGRGSPVRAGTKFQIAIQGKRRPVQLFTMGNIKKDSFGIDWLPMDERANEVTVTYFDKNDFGKQKSVTVHSKKARERGDHPKPTELTLYGVNNLEQATKEATFAMNMNVLLKTVKFEAPIESIACTIGDVIAVQHDMPKWGQGGLLASGSTRNVIRLDHPVNFDVDGQYVAMVRHDQVVQFTSEIETVLGNTVFLGFGFNVTNFDRFRRLRHVPSGRDLKILEPTIDKFGRHGLVLENASGMKPTDTVQLIDTDVVETINVIKPSGTAPVTSLTLASPLKVAPKEETPWAFGLKDVITGLYSIVGISGDQDMWRKISAIEYSDEAYSDDVTEWKPVPVPTSPVLGDVVFGGFKERRYLSGGIYRSEVEFTWSHPSLIYAYAEVHVSIDGEPWRLVGANASIYSVELTAGELRVKLIPVNLQGNKPNFDAITEQVYTVAAGAPRNPPKPQDIRAEARKTTIEIKWGDIDAWAANKNVYRYEVWGAKGENANLADAKLLAITGNDHYPHVGLPSDTSYTYWVRAVNILANDKKSDFSPPGGLTVKTLPADTLSELFPDGINLVDLLPDGSELVDTVFPDGIGRLNLSEELQKELETPPAIEDISQIVSELAAKVEMVTDGNKVEVFQRKEAIAGVEAFVRQEITTLVDANGAVAQMITELEARVDEDIAAQLSEEKQTRASADSALSASITKLQAQVNNDITAAINEEKIVRAAADSAIATQVTQLQAKVNNDITAAINSEAVTRANADSALSGQLTALTTRVGSAESAITAEVQARSTADTAIAASVTNLQTKMGNDIAAAVKTEEVARANADSALASQITTLTSRVANSESRITSESQNRATADSALAAQITSVEAKIATDIAAAVKTETLARTNADNALAGQITSVSTRLGAAESGLTSEAQTRATADSALSASVTALQTKMGNDIAAAVKTEETARVAADNALAGQITTLTTRLGKAESSVTAEVTARANGDSALAASISALESKMGTDIAAAVKVETQARTTADNAMSTQLTSVTTRVGAAESTITQQATSIDGLRAQYTVKINSNGHIVGFSLASRAANDSSASEFTVVADRFKVVRPGSTSPIPVFVVDAALNRVVLANAIVGNMQSDNYVAGVSGWCIKK